METQVLQDLNEAQRRAFELEGGCVILAGAGTGKTRVIIQRIAGLLESGRARPDEITALTFSRKAAAEMQDRLARQVPFTGEQVTVDTFHGFCRSLLAEWGLEIGLSPDFRLLDQATLYRTIRQVVGRAFLREIIIPAQPKEFYTGLLRFFSRAKDELVEPAHLAQFARSQSDPAQRRYWVEMTSLYQAFQNDPRRAGALDFGDLQVKALDLLRRSARARQWAEDRTRYLLVDEFQDTNIAQIELILTLKKRYRNLCVVGDDDQGIYRFRGASYASFARLRQQWPDIPVVRLDQNYRSTPAILSVADCIIRQNPDRMDPDKKIWTDRTEGPPVDLRIYPDLETEAEAIATELARDPREESIAVFYRSHAQKDLLLEALRRHGVPVAVAGPQSALEDSGVRDWLCALQAVADPADTVSLFRLMCWPPVALPPPACLQAAEQSRRDAVPMLDVLRRMASSKKNSSAWRVAIRGFLEFFDQLQLLGHQQKLTELAMALLQRSRWVVEGQRNLTVENERRICAVSHLIRWIQRYQKETDRPTLQGLLEFLDAMEQIGLGPGEEEEPVTAPGTVQLMTIHRAKGLEFDRCYLIGLIRGRFPSQRRTEVFEFPPALMKEALPPGDALLQEERRLFYVGLTRARRRLVLSTVDKPYYRPSPFIDHLRSAHSQGRLADEVLQIRTVAPFPNPPLDRLARWLTPPGPLIAAGHPSVAAGNVTIPLPRNFQLSYSQLQTYETCPLKYKFQYVYQLPTERSDAMIFGTLMHDALHQYYRHVLRARRTLALPALQRLLTRHWNPKAFSSPAVARQYRSAGLRMLAAFYRDRQVRVRTPLYLEKGFLLPFEGFSLKGFIDRIDPVDPQDPKKIEILDYKTGKVKDEKEAEKDHQLTLYALACQRLWGLEPVRLTLYFLQGAVCVSTPCHPEKFQAAEAWIREKAQAIIARNFPPDPSSFKCRRCDYQRICPVWDK